MGPEGALICLSHRSGGGAKWNWVGRHTCYANSFSSHSETVRFPLMSNITWQEIKKSIT